MSQPRVARPDASPERPSDKFLGALRRVSQNKYLGPGTVLVTVGAALSVIWMADPTTPGGALPTCPTKALFHIDCPGCGSLRAIYSLMHGDIGAALHYNAVGVLAIVALTVSFVTYTVGLWTGRRLWKWQTLRYAPAIVLGIALVWFVIRNIPVEPFSSLKV